MQRQDPRTEPYVVAEAGACAPWPQGWAMQLRVARRTERLEEVVGFYRDGIGLAEIGGFCNHDGYDGVFLAVPGTGAHLELTAGGGHGAPAPQPESLLVLYLGGDEAVQKVAARLGVDPIPPANRYWAEHGGDVPGSGRLPRRPRARALGALAASSPRHRGLETAPFRASTAA